GLTYTTTAAQTSLPGSYPITPANGVAANYTFTYQPGALTIRALPIVAVGADINASPTVALYNAYGQRFSLQPFGASFPGGVGVATGGGTVAVYDGPNLFRVRTLTPFGPGYTGGVNVAVYSDYLAIGRGIGPADVNVYRMSDLAPVTTIQTQATGPQSGYAG